MRVWKFEDDLLTGVGATHPEFVMVVCIYSCLSDVAAKSLTLDCRSVKGPAFVERLENRGMKNLLWCLLPCRCGTVRPVQTYL